MHFLAQSAVAGSGQCGRGRGAGLQRVPAKAEGVVHLRFPAGVCGGGAKGGVSSIPFWGLLGGVYREGGAGGGVAVGGAADRGRGSRHNGEEKCPRAWM